MPVRTGSPRKYDYMAILDWIDQYKKAHDGNSPSLRQIMDQFEISSSSVVANILQNLKKDGWLLKTGIRAIEINRSKWKGLHSD